MVSKTSVACSALLAVAACIRTPSPVETHPYPVSASADVERSDLEIPRDLEVRSASYSVTGLPDVSGIGGNTSSNVQVRPILTVYAVRRATGEQLLLVYDDLAQRKQPSRIVRLVAGSGSLQN
jgi:hypothetical protein